MANYPIEALLRPPVEWSTTVAALSMSGIVLLGHDRMLMTSKVAYGLAAILTALALVRFWQRLARGALSPRAAPQSAVSDPFQSLILIRKAWCWGAAFAGRRCTRNACGMRPGPATSVFSNRVAMGAAAAGAKEPFSGLPALHGVGLLEGQQRIVLPHSERQGHLFYVGTTGVGKTRAAELAIIQDIRRGNPVICMDPKGDPDLFRCLYAEAVAFKTSLLLFPFGLSRSLRPV